MAQRWHAVWRWNIIDPMALNHRRVNVGTCHNVKSCHWWSNVGTLDNTRIWANNWFKRWSNIWQRMVLLCSTRGVLSTCRKSSKLKALWIYLIHLSFLLRWRRFQNLPTGYQRGRLTLKLKLFSLFDSRLWGCPHYTWKANQVCITVLYLYIHLSLQFTRPVVILVYYYCIRSLVVDRQFRHGWK